MSQVVVTNDALREKRAKSANEEHAIDRHGQFEHWKMPTPAVKTTPVERLIGLAALPVVFFWSLLLSVLGAGLSLALICFRVLAAIWPSQQKERAGN